MISTSFAPFPAWLVLLSSVLWSYEVLGQTTAVNTALENETGFIGWYLGPSTTQALTDPLTWTTSGNYARGCSATGSCGYATDCQDNSITYDDGVTSSCNVCRTMTIFQSEPYATPSASNIFCAEVWEAFTVFRELPATTTSSESSSTPTSSAISRTIASSTLSATVSFTESPAATKKPSSSSKAWIAGAVVGPVIGVALIAALGWFLYRRKQKQHPWPPEMPIISENSRPSHPPAELAATSQELATPQELEATPPELDSGNHPRGNDLSSFSYK